MWKWNIIYLVAAVTAGLLGFAGVAGTVAMVAKSLSVFFVVLFLMSLVQQNT